MNSYISNSNMTDLNENNQKKDSIKFLKHGTVFLVFFIFTLVFYYLFCSYIISIPLGSYAEISERIDYKLELAKEFDLPKIVLVSGSNSHFSLSAEKMQAELDMPVFNFGTNASVYYHIFTLSKEILKKDDIVIANIEYPLFFCKKKTAFSPVRIGELYMINSQEYSKRVSFLEKLNLKLLTGRDFVAWINNNSFPDRDELPDSSETINQNGDSKVNTVENTDLTVLKGLVTDPIEFDNRRVQNFPETDCFEEIVKFKDWCHENEIQFYLSFPTVVKFDEYSNNEYQEIFQKIITESEKAGIDIIGKPNDFMYPIDFFYNSGYHLNSKGRDINTDFVIELIRKIVEK
jgi:hypothetical protein